MPAAWVSAGVGLVGLYEGSQNASDSQQQAQQAQKAADPYAQYRPQAAQQLNSFVNNPNSYDAVANSSVGMAYQQAAARTMAAQGYTGSGNALVAAANAGGQAYQQQFNNLATLAGANYNPAAAGQIGANNASNAYEQNNNTMDNLGAVANQFTKAYQNSYGSNSNYIPPIPDSGQYAPPVVSMN